MQDPFNEYLILQLLELQEPSLWNIHVVFVCLFVCYITFSSFSKTVIIIVSNVKVIVSNIKKKKKKKNDAVVSSIPIMFSRL